CDNYVFLCLQCTVQVKLELGHRAQLRKKVTSEGFTHDWMVFVRGPENSDIQHFVDKVVFRLHESFPKPKRVCKEPPYKVEESGYAGFLILFLQLFCPLLLFSLTTSKGDVERDGSSKSSRDPSSSSSSSSKKTEIKVKDENKVLPKAAFKEPKLTQKESKMEGIKEGSKVSKSHKMAKEHRERPRKDSESKTTSKGDVERDGSSKSSRDPSSSSSSSSKKTEIKVKDENKVLPKAAFKEPKLTPKESKMEGMSPKGGGAGSAGGGGGGGAADGKAPSKRPSNVESPKPSVKKPKKGGSEGSKGSSSGGLTGTSPRTASSSTASSGYVDKKASKEKGRWAKGKSEAQEVKESKKPPESDDSNSDDEASSKSEFSQTAIYVAEAHCGFWSVGPLRSMVEDLQSEESDDDDSSSDEETPVKNNLPGRDSRSFSLFPVSAYTEELVDLHRRLMALRERSVLQQIVNLIEETGHFNVTNTTFDFDLFSLDESTVRKLQSYLEATAT
uniref:MLLT1 super elongation complex subunit n=1 Tax=Sinocyclocheilus grahami TaxID=75366 RepID=A0A672LLG1_SINGR